jgi:hypothetical protein
MSEGCKCQYVKFICSYDRSTLSHDDCLSMSLTFLVFEGRVVYTPTSFIDILPDHYKQKPISLYNPRKAPLFNQYRLIVPRTRNILEVCQFIILLTLFLLVMADRDPSTFGVVELVFIIFALGWILDQFVVCQTSLNFIPLTAASGCRSRILEVPCTDLLHRVLFHLLQPTLGESFGRKWNPSWSEPPLPVQPRAMTHRNAR